METDQSPNKNFDNEWRLWEKYGIEQRHLWIHNVEKVSNYLIQQDEIDSSTLSTSRFFLTQYCAMDHTRLQWYWAGYMNNGPAVKQKKNSSESTIFLKTFLINLCNKEYQFSLLPLGILW